MTQPITLPRHLAIIGCGHIGTSLALAVRKAVQRITVCDHSPEHRRLLQDMALADAVLEDPTQAVAEADTVVLATPLSACPAICQTIAPALQEGAIVTDVGSVKTVVEAWFEAHLPAHCHRVPGHPVAGTEKSGPGAGLVDMFQGRMCVLTPTAHTAPHAIDTLKTLWRAAGAHVEVMPPQQHDRILALTSHLPHLIAYALVHTAETSDTQAVTRFAAGGFRDFTRIADSDPVMWRDVFLNNQGAVLEELQRFRQDLQSLETAVRNGEGAALQAWFERTRTIRDSVIAHGQAGQFSPQG